MAESDIAGAMIPVIGTAINAWSQERNLEENANQARIQRQWQEKMWNKNNEYNTPLAQKHRLEEAGINPYSVLAQGGADTGVSSSPVQPYQRADANFHSPMDENAFMNSLLLGQQIKSAELDNESKGISLKYQEQNEVKRLILLDEQINDMIQSKRQKRQNTEYLEHLSELTRKRIDSLVRSSEAEAGQAETILRNLQRQYDDQHAESVVNQALGKANVRLSKAQHSSLLQGIKESIARIREINASEDLTRQQKLNLIDEIKNNERSRVSSRLHDRIDVNKFNKELWKDINELIDDATSFDVPFGKISLPRPLIHTDDIKSLGIDN